MWQGTDSIAPYAVIKIGDSGEPLLQGFRELAVGGRTGTCCRASSQAHAVDHRATDTHL